MIEAMKQALEALKANDKLINGEENRFGLEGAMDGYYSGCFDVDGVNKLTEQAITSLRQAIAEAEKQEPVACPYCKNWATLGAVYYHQNCAGCVKRMTHPQPKREWIGLTDEEIAEGHKESWVTQQAFESAVWWAEAKLKEKNT